MKVDFNILFINKNIYYLAILLFAQYWIYIIIYIKIDSSLSLPLLGNKCKPKPEAYFWTGKPLGQRNCQFENKMEKFWNFKECVHAFTFAFPTKYCQSNFFLCPGLLEFIGDISLDFREKLFYSLYFFIITAVLPLVMMTAINSHAWLSTDTTYYIIRTSSSTY